MASIVTRTKCCYSLVNWKLCRSLLATTNRTALHAVLDVHSARAALIGFRCLLLVVLPSFMIVELLKERVDSNCALPSPHEARSSPCLQCFQSNVICVYDIMINRQVTEQKAVRYTYYIWEKTTIRQDCELKLSEFETVDSVTVSWQESVLHWYTLTVDSLMINLMIIADDRWTPCLTLRWIHTYSSFCHLNYSLVGACPVLSYRLVHAPLLYHGWIFIFTPRLGRGLIVNSLIWKINIFQTFQTFWLHTPSHNCRLSELFLVILTVNFIIERFIHCLHHLLPPPTWRRDHIYHCSSLVFLPIVPNCVESLF